MIEAAKHFQDKDYQALLVTGERHFDAIQAQIEMIQPTITNVKVVPYIENMPALFKSIDLVACRSGATTLTELTALGVASILIPSPYVTNNHQLKNAESLSHNQAAEILEEKDLNGSSLFTLIDDLLSDDEKRAAMADRAKALGVPDAADRLYQLVDELMTQ